MKELIIRARFLISHVGVAVITAFTISMLPSSHPNVFMQYPTHLELTTSVQRGFVTQHLEVPYVKMVKESR